MCEWCELNPGFQNVIEDAALWQRGVGCGLPSTSFGSNLSCLSFIPSSNMN